MTLSDLCIRKPVLTVVMNLLFILVGLIAYDRLSIREYPKIDEPVVTVETNYLGASAEIIESQVTQPLEESLAGIEGVDVLSSISRPEFSQITLRFKVTRNPDAAASDVRDRVSRTRGNLPKEIDEPIVAKVEADAQPIIYLAFTGDIQSPLEITDYADRYVKDRLQTIQGVAEVRILGERRYAMRLWLDPIKLAGYNLTPEDVELALLRENIEVPAGRIESATREFTVLTETDLKNPEQFNDLIIKNVQGYPLRLRDVGRAELGAQDDRLIARYNGENAVALGIVKQATANPLDISQEVRKVLKDVRKTLPVGMQVDVAFDSSVFIDRSIKAVYQTILEAIVLVMLVIFLFLRDLKAITIPLVTIPVSLIGSLAFMYVFGFSINTLTLLAMVLAIGLVVDDAIVMLENIHRHIEEGMSSMAAAFKGSQEISFAILAMTLTLSAVYAPIAFVQGRTGRLFVEFALTLAGAVLVSGFVALTLSPLMCSRFLSHHKTENKFYNAIERFLIKVHDGYRTMLPQVLERSRLVIVLFFLTLVANCILFKILPSEVAPVEDRGTIVGFGLAPEGSTIEYSDKYAQEMEQVLKKVPEIDRYFVVTGYPVVSQIISFSILKPWEERKRKQQDIVNELMPQMFSIPGIMGFPLNPASLGQSPIARPVELVLQGSFSYEKLDEFSQAVMNEARKSPHLLNPDTDLKLNQPQLSITVHRNKASDVHVPISSINLTLQTLLGSLQVTRFKKEGKLYDVIVQIEKDKRREPTDISQIFVRGKNDVMIQLSNLLEVKETVAPKELNHFNQRRSALITASLAPGSSLSQALGYLENAATKIGGSSVQIDFNGESREFKQSGSEIYITFLLALAFIYLVLAAQFESFRDPLIIMLTVPLSMAGALLALYLTGNTLNIYSQIGLVTLVGLITKHGILIVEFANQLREQGKSVREAILESAILRLRPILMTTGAMVLGSVPLAFALGAGAESRHAIGWVIVGGLLVGTLFTLFVIPTMYVLLSSGHKGQMNDTP